MKHGPFIKRGYAPLASSACGVIAWRGEHLPDMWMWNGQYSVYKGGILHIQTVKVTTLKDAALRFWRDGWVPVRPMDDALLRRMEAELRGHRGLKAAGACLPDAPFLRKPDPIPEEYLGPEMRAYLGLPRLAAQGDGFEREGAIPEETLDAFRRRRV
ncbi:MAG: hypothetical protein HZB85_02175 [Deltaproteobacteria bacterium]|nr:hypothetical protein [Deltaproteobacteria bacterium]